jgi:hypothetical protein
VQRLRHNPLEESKEFAGDQANLRQTGARFSFCYPPPDLHTILLNFMNKQYMNIPFPKGIKEHKIEKMSFFSLGLHFCF